MYFGHLTSIKNFSVVAALGFLWFTFLAPEATNAARNGNFCLIAFFASLAFFNYQRFTELQQSIMVENQDRYTNERMDDLQRQLEDRQNMKAAHNCCKK
jgi:hypothetical protein